MRTTEEQLKEVNGGYVYRVVESDGERYEIIRDSDGEVIFSYKQSMYPMGYPGFGPLPKWWRDPIDSGLIARAMGQSPDMISWETLNNLRNNHK